MFFYMSWVFISIRKGHYEKCLASYPKVIGILFNSAPTVPDNMADNGPKFSKYSKFGAP